MRNWVYSSFWCFSSNFIVYFASTFALFPSNVVFWGRILPIKARKGQTGNCDAKKSTFTGSQVPPPAKVSRKIGHGFPPLLLHRPCFSLAGNCHVSFKWLQQNHTAFSMSPLAASSRANFMQIYFASSVKSPALISQRLPAFP